MVVNFIILKSVKGLKEDLGICYCPTIISLIYINKIWGILTWFNDVNAILNNIVTFSYQLLCEE